MAPRIIPSECLLCCENGGSVDL